MSDCLAQAVSVQHVYCKNEIATDGFFQMNKGDWTERLEARW